MSSKFIIKVESSMEQQENLKNSRKCLKVLQKTSGDKENFGQKPIGPLKAFIKSKSENEINDPEAKRKRVVTLAVQTDPERLELTKITESDLTTDGEPSEAYWKVLAEKRRIAMELTLQENAELEEERANLMDMLDVSAQMLDESRNLVEILTEMLQENEDEAAVGNNTSSSSSSSTRKDEAGFEQGESSKNQLLSASLAAEATESDADPTVERESTSTNAESTNED